MLRLTPRITIPDTEIRFQAMRAQGAGGQNVNKVSSAIHLFFDIPGSSLPEAAQARLMQMRDHRITPEGRIIIKAQQYRTQDKNREDALARLAVLLRQSLRAPTVRKPTKPTLSARRKRVDHKVHRSGIKANRGRIRDTGG